MRRNAALLPLLLVAVFFLPAREARAALSVEQRIAVLQAKVKNNTARADNVTVMSTSQNNDVVKDAQKGVTQCDKTYEELQKLLTA